LGSLSHNNESNLNMETLTDVAILMKLDFSFNILKTYVFAIKIIIYKSYVFLNIVNIAGTPNYCYT
jgi:hypothetical protein